MRYIKIILIMILGILMYSCIGTRHAARNLKEGVSGKVYWLAGNFMPSPDRPQQQGAVPVRRTLYIYRQTKISDAEGEAPLFTSVRSELVKKVKSNKAGYFQCALGPGRYSLFTAEEDGKLFANLFNGDGYINVFEVKQGEVTVHDVHINYKAAF